MLHRQQRRAATFSVCAPTTWRRTAVLSNARPLHRKLPETLGRTGPSIVDSEVELVLALWTLHYSPKNLKVIAQRRAQQNPIADFHPLPPKVLSVHRSFSKGQLESPEQVYNGVAANLFWIEVQMPSHVQKHLTSPLTEMSFPVKVKDHDLRRANCICQTSILQ